MEEEFLLLSLFIVHSSDVFLLHSQVTFPQNTVMWVSQLQNDDTSARDESRNGLTIFICKASIKSFPILTKISIRQGSNVWTAFVERKCCVDGELLFLRFYAENGLSTPVPNAFSCHRKSLVRLLSIHFVKLLFHSSVHFDFSVSWRNICVMFP